jgi:hypothetical protein
MSEMVTYRSFHPRHFPITPEIHAAIEKVYLRDTGNGQVRALSIRLGYPRWKITRYAIQCGLIAKQKKEPDWSDREIHVLELNAHRSPETIQRKLKAAGLGRSVTGIVLKRKRMRFLGNLNGMSANSLAQCLGVDSHFVTRAIKAGRLRATMRETKRTPQQGGDAYYILPKDIRTYILNWLCEIDIRKVSKWWFCDLLANKK